MIKNIYMIFRSFVLIFFIISCKQDSTILEPAGWNLNGNWDVFHIRFDDVIIDTSYLNIVQSNTHVFFKEGIDTISIGIIQTDTICCSDMWGVGISKIFIDDDDHMRSETPNLEILKMLYFKRQ
jgi:hypothetical protein